MSYCPTLTPRKQGNIRQSVRLSLFLAAALCLPAGLAWAQGRDNGNGNGGINNGNQNGRDNGNDNNDNRNVAPEIDPTVAVSALAILTGGILLVGDQVHKGRRNGEG